ncbi:hypothetical protein L6452_14856 [Arctium lappa]|uniref:Uncharacterized protein n=1 Tax=Arctium lappa TaxID=4217 RepID=A0ACB9CM80_ARCLA|nr:hypothetical protein L6452_14856 [Arctium lappa]
MEELDVSMMLTLCVKRNILDDVKSCKFGDNNVMVFEVFMLRLCSIIDYVFNQVFVGILSRMLRNGGNQGGGGIGGDLTGVSGVFLEYWWVLVTTEETELTMVTWCIERINGIDDVTHRRR